jgi:hypothetical protein
VAEVVTVRVALAHLAGLVTVLMVAEGAMAVLAVVEGTVVLAGPVVAVATLR